MPSKSRPQSLWKGLILSTLPGGSCMAQTRRSGSKQIEVVDLLRSVSCSCSWYFGGALTASFKAMLLIWWHTCLGLKAIADASLESQWDSRTWKLETSRRKRRAFATSWIPYRYSFSWLVTSSTSIRDAPGGAADWGLHSETHYAPRLKAGPLKDVLPPCCWVQWSLVFVRWRLFLDFIATLCIHYVRHALPHLNTYDRLWKVA